MNTVQSQIDKIARERVFWRAMRGMVSNESTKIIADGFSSRIKARLRDLSEQLDSADPTDVTEISKAQSARRELKEVLKDFDEEHIKNKNILLDKQLKELQDAIQIKPRTGTSGPVPPR